MPPFWDGPNLHVLADVLGFCIRVLGSLANRLLYILISNEQLNTLKFIQLVYCAHILIKSSYFQEKKQF